MSFSREIPTCTTRRRKKIAVGKIIKNSERQESLLKQLLDLTAYESSAFTLI